MTRAGPEVRERCLSDWVAMKFLLYALWLLQMNKDEVVPWPASQRGHGLVDSMNNSLYHAWLIVVSLVHIVSWLRLL